MRNILFFDLPVQTAKQKRDYRIFTKMLIKNGYIMMQESVYSKILLNYTAKEAEIERLRKQVPKEGLIQCLVVTEKQYTSMYYLTGENRTNKENSIERFIVI